MGELFNAWFRFEVPGLGGEIAMPAPEFTPLQPTDLPAGFQSTSMMGGGSAQAIEFTYFSGEQFVALAQRKAFIDKSLPAGRKTAVKGQPAVMVTGLKGTIDLGTPPAGPTPVPAKPINYTDGKRLTWYVGEVKAEILSNLSEGEILKIAESLAPAKQGQGKPRIIQTSHPTLRAAAQEKVPQTYIISSQIPSHRLVRERTGKSRSLSYSA